MSLADLHKSLCFIIYAAWVRVIITMQIEMVAKFKVNIRLY